MAAVAVASPTPITKVVVAFYGVHKCNGVRTQAPRSSRETVTVARSTNARTDIPSSRVSLFASPLPLFVSSTPLRIMELLRGRGGHRGLPNIPRALPSFLTRYDLYCPLRACAFFPSIHRRCSRALAALNLNDDRRIESKNAMIQIF